MGCRGSQRGKLTLGKASRRGTMEVKVREITEVLLPPGKGCEMPGRRILCILTCGAWISCLPLRPRSVSIDLMEETTHDTAVRGGNR